jgi:hypothetical protein
MARLALILFVLASPLLGGCALMMADRSWSVELKDDDAQVVAETIAALVADRIQADGQPIMVTPAGIASHDGLEARLATALKSRGFRVDPPETGEGHALRYLLTLYGEGYVLRVTLDDAEASTILVRGDNGELLAAAPLALREDRR